MRKPWIAVVGAGPAGCAAALQCRRLGHAVRLLDPSGHPGGRLHQARRVENYLGLKPQSGTALARRMARHLARWRIPVTPLRVQQVASAPGGFCLQTERGLLAAAVVILAPGTIARSLPQLAPGVSPDARLQHFVFEDVTSLLERHPNAARVAVVGGGEAALDGALSLADAGCRVTVLVRGERLRACRALRAEAALRNEIEVRTRQQLEAVHLARDAGAPALELILDTPEPPQNRQRVAALLIAIGRRSAVPPLLAPELLDEQGRPRRCPGLFIVGDARRGALGQAGIAVGDGLAAAAAADRHLRRRARKRSLPAPRQSPLLEVVARRGDPQLACLHVARTRDGALIEFVESIQPPRPREEKWVLILSTLKGCPVACRMCDAGGHYRGRLDAAQMLAQIDYMIDNRFPSAGSQVPVARLKIQFARMGDPAFNDAVLEVLDELPARYAGPLLMPSISTIAPRGRDRFFTDLAHIKERHYGAGRFQMQFSIHTTDDRARRRLIPTATWSLGEIGRWGETFYRRGDRKLTLNFAPVAGLPLDPEQLATCCPPQRFLIKLTPINPTRAAAAAGLRGRIDPGDPAGCRRMAKMFEAAGFETLLSIGELRENQIGSNCGMHARTLEAIGASR